MNLSFASLHILIWHTVSHGLHSPWSAVQYFSASSNYSVLSSLLSQENCGTIEKHYCNSWVHSWVLKNKDRCSFSNPAAKPTWQIAAVSHWRSAAETLLTCLLEKTELASGLECSFLPRDPWLWPLPTGMCQARYYRTLAVWVYLLLSKYKRIATMWYVCKFKIQLLNKYGNYIQNQSWELPLLNH